MGGVSGQRGTGGSGGRRRAVDVAAELGVDPKRLRAWLRREYPRQPSDHGGAWLLDDAQVAAARRQFRPGMAGAPPLRPTTSAPKASTRDEAYVFDLCDGILGEQAIRQHRFSWLRGDPDARGSSRTLPVDGYYPGHRLVIEFHEVQHREAVRFFDKPDKMTVSGMNRGRQRQRYDERRTKLIPEHGLRLLVIPSSALSLSRGGRLGRDVGHDRAVLAGLLQEFVGHV